MKKLLINGGCGFLGSNLASYGKEVMLDPGRASEPVLLSDDEYFVLGDNRNNSKDSRFEEVGNIKRSELMGKVWIRIYPFKEFGPV